MLLTTLTHARVQFLVSRMKIINFGFIQNILFLLCRVELGIQFGVNEEFCSLNFNFKERLKKKAQVG